MKNWKKTLPYILASFLFSATSLHSNSEDASELVCSFEIVCLETNACSTRDLVIRVIQMDGGGEISTPGQTFEISTIQDGGSGAVTILSKELNGTTAFLSIFASGGARLTLHFHRPEPSAMTNFGNCQ